MPSPGRRAPPPPAHISRSSPSYHRHRSPDRSRLGPSRPDGSSRISPSRQRDRRRSPEHASSRSQPDSRSRPRESRDTLPLKRPSLPETTNPNGRSLSAATSNKRKASPKRDRDVPRPLDRIESGSSSLTVSPRKMMRSTSPEMSHSRPVLHLGPSSVSSRSYPHPTAVISTRHYVGPNEVKPVARSYTITPAPPPVDRYASEDSPPSQRYSNPTRATAVTELQGYVPAAKSSTSRGYLDSSTFRRSASEERFLERPSAQKRATDRGTSSRFGNMQDTDKASILRMDMNPSTLSGYVFNINNEPNPKFSREHAVVRDLVNPESLQVVRRAASRSGTIKYNYPVDWENDEEELYRPLMAHRMQTVRNGEGKRPIFERDEIIHQQRAVGDDVHIRHREHSPVQQVARYVSPEPYREPPNFRDSHDKQPRSTHSRDVPSSSRPVATSRSAYYEEPPERVYRSREYVQGDDIVEHREPSRPVVRHDDRDDLRRELELKRVVGSKHSPERARDSTRRRDGERSRTRGSRAESESDLRVQINEKRTTHSRERGYERERPSERREHPSEHKRERRHSPSGGERRRPSDSYERRERSHRDTSPRYREHREGPKPWEVDPEFVPRGRAYFEHDNREEMQMIRGRGMMGMRPGFVYRGRGIRRPYRGAPFIHGGFVMGRGPPRGYPPPRKFPESAT